MLGLGSSITRSGKIGKRIVRDGLVLKHDYNAGAVEPCSTGAASFDYTTGDFIDLGDLAAFDFASDFTLSAWIKAEGSSDYNAIMSNYETDKGWWFILNDGKLRMGLENQIDTSYQGLDLRDGKWHHVAATCTTSNIILYTDGVLIYEKTGQTWTPAQTSSATTMIGKRTGIDEFDGYMANVGVWSAALTQAQVKSIMHKDYASLSDSEKTNLVSWWNLDSTIGESTGTTGNSQLGTYTSDKDLVLGPEMVANFGFEDSSKTEYTTANATYSYVAGNNGLEIVGTGLASEVGNQKVTLDFIDNTATATKYYLVSFDITATSGTTNAGIIMSGTGISIDKGNARTHYWYPSTIGTHSSVVTVTGNSTFALHLHIGTAVGASATFDNVSLKEITGNTGTLS